MSQLEKLKQLQKQQRTQAQQSNMTQFDDLVVIHVGCASVTEHFPKIRDENGNKLKDDKGNDLRSDKRDGFTHTFAQFGTAKTVKIVLPEDCTSKLSLLSAYSVSGLGYDIKQAGMIFIEQNGSIKNY